MDNMKKKSGENRGRKYRNSKMVGNGGRLLLSPHEKDNRDKPSDIYR